MRHRKLMAAVLSLAVILGVVSCKQQRDTEIGKDDNEITSTAQATLGETNPVSEEDNASEQAPAPDLDGTYNSELEIVEFTTSETTSEEMTSAKEQTTSHSAKHSDEPIPTESLKETEAPKATATPKPTSAPKATNTAAPTATPVPTEIPKATNTPTPTPVPTSTPTPVPTSTPTPVPTPFDINQSARDNGYEIIDIDMGGGQTQRIYGYYVDMSELDNMSNDYRESLGLPRLPKDTNHIEEMKIRAAEITLPNHFYHKRPNGKAAKESNIVSGTDPRDCYERLFNSPGHRAAWEDPYATTLYSVGFRQMEFNTETGKWSEGSGATVQYLDYSL